MDTPIELEGFDYREAAKYIAITKDEYERMPPGLAQHLPWRRFKTGHRPGITGEACMEKEKDDSQWRFPRRELMDHVKQMIFCQMSQNWMPSFISE